MMYLLGNAGTVLYSRSSGFCFRPLFYRSSCFCRAVRTPAVEQNKGIFNGQALCGQHCFCIAQKLRIHLKFNGYIIALLHHDSSISRISSVPLNKK
jgi:hypothetical protein